MNSYLEIIMKITFSLCLLLVLSACSTLNNSSKDEINKIKKYEIYTLNSPISLGKTFASQEVFLGGFSGLSFNKKEAGEYYFQTITDRGPNGWPNEKDRPFLLPEFSPRIINLKTTANNTLEIVKQIPLIKKNGKPMTGLPNVRTEENPVDVFGFTYSIDPDGLDTEALVPDEEGGYWIGEEYGPSLVHLSAEGKMLRRLFPAYELPRVYAERKANRGFEGIAKIDSKIFGFLQSPLPIDEKFSRIVEFDLETFKTSAEYYYPFDDGVDKIGDAVALPNKTMLVIEQNGKTGDKSYKKIYKISLNKSDDKVSKVLVADLDQTPFKDLEKIEGIAFIDKNHIAVVNDNDFNIKAETNFKTGETPFGNTPSQLMIIELENSL